MNRLGKDAPLMVLCLTEPGEGIAPKQISKINELLLTGKKYVPVEYHASGASAYGYVEAGYYEDYSYASDLLEEAVFPILDDNLKTSDGVYAIADNRYFYMSHFIEGEEM